MKQTELSLKTWIKLARAFNTVNKAINDEINSYGVTPSQFGVLEALYHLGDMTIGKLGEKILVTGGNMTVILDNLEKNGFVERIKNNKDRRSNYIRLTDKGKQLIETVFPNHTKLIQNIFFRFIRRRTNSFGKFIKKIRFIS
jgi:MarR family 2-MHQ and catechol resistance regulon transcriptional repressor